MINRPIYHRFIRFIRYVIYNKIHGSVVLRETILQLTDSTGLQVDTDITRCTDINKLIDTKDRHRGPTRTMNNKTSIS